MSVVEVIYENPWRPDGTNARHVLAILLVPLAVVLSGVELADIADIREMLEASKREALINWYASRKERA